MTSTTDRGPARALLFPIGNLIFSQSVQRHLDEGRLDPGALVQRHARGDWGDVPDCRWRQSDAALQSGGRLDSFYELTRELRIRVFTLADRSATYVVLSHEY
ncbi:MAG TPA: hypothetical protein VF457_01050 [Burkholderiaceae bacterium]